MILLPALIVIGCIIFWFLASAVFRPLGKFIQKILTDVEGAIKEEKENGEK